MGWCSWKKKEKPGLEPGLGSQFEIQPDFAVPKVRLTWLTSE